MKLDNLTIENFRGFDGFTLNHLGRVNLLVGTNNSGKTTVLEAAFILLAPGEQKLSAVAKVLSQRGEVSSETSESGLEVRRLFNGHRLELDSTIRIASFTPLRNFETVLSVKPAYDALEEIVANETHDSFFKKRGFFRKPLYSTVLSIKWLPETDNSKDILFDYIPLLEERSLALTDLKSRTTQTSQNSNLAPVHFINASSLSSFAVKSFYESLVLTPEEDLIVEALRIIEPRIERIASGSIGVTGATGINISEFTSRRGILIRISGVEERVPIGSMGDGIWRLLGLALSVVHSRNGTLLIDEIDTGLHHSVMSKMWRFLDECSKKFNVQIIATTHSRDCYQSLATICREGFDDTNQSEITIQRIERNRSEAVAYSEAMIIAAADNDVEVR